MLFSLLGALPASAAVELTMYSTAKAFSPNGDGSEDTRDISFYMYGPANVSIVVKRGAETIRTITADESRPSGGVQFGWDGRDDSGQIVDDGEYEVVVTAIDRDGIPVVRSLPTAVDSRVPGVLTAPGPGATVSGLVDLAVTPTAGVGVSSVYWSLPGCSWSQNTADADGVFRVGQADTSGCYSGEQDLSWGVSWTDQYGQGHSYGGSVRVTVADTTAPVARLYYGSAAHQTITRTSPTGLSSAWVSFGCSDASAVSWGWELSDAAGRLVRSWAPGAPGSSANNWCSDYNSAWVWVDGLDQDGQLLPDGDYTLTATVTDAGGLSGTATATITVDSRVPGVLTAPGPGATLSGRPRFVFTPAPGFGNIAQVGLSLASHGFGIYNASPDGTWRTSLPMGGLPQGAASLWWGVSWTDTDGQGHYYSAEPVEVAIDPVSIPLAASIDPTSGTAPLSATLHLETSDPQSRNLTARITWGDGSTQTRQVPSPYDPIEIQHVYTEPGVYTAFVSVSNGEGGYASQSIPVTANGKPNTAPSLQATVTPASGSVPLTVTATMTAVDPEGDNLTYRVDFGDGSQPETGVLPLAGPLTHEYRKAGSYLVRVSASDGKLTSSQSARVQVALSEPLAAVAGDDISAVVGSPVHFDGTSSRPVVGIDSYAWDFGDGSSATSPSADHSYRSPGTYKATLTVTAGTKTSTDSVNVVVAPVPSHPGLTVTVAQDGGASLPGADVVVIDSNGTKYSAVSDEAGQGVISTIPDGDYTVYVWKQGFQPEAIETRVRGGSGTARVVLKSGEVTTAEVTSRPLTYEEILAAGIDPDDPDNQHLYEFEVHLAFGPFPAVVTGIAGSGAGGGGGGGGGGGVIYNFGVAGDGIACDDTCTFTLGGNTVTVSVGGTEQRPQLVWMVIPGRAKWLKEFFSVSMLVTNLASPSFRLADGAATLTLPAGLTLAPTGKPQSVTQNLPDIPGGQSASAEWVLRGDQEGLYDLSAAYSGSLEPLGKPIAISAVAAKPLHVWGGSALRMTVDTDDKAYERYPYHATFSLTNVADVPIYNASLELLKKGKLNYIYQPREQLEVTTARLQPGGTLEREYVLIPRISGVLDLRESFILKTGGDVVVPGTITSHPAKVTPANAREFSVYTYGNGLGFTWEPVAGASDYRAYRTVDPDTDFGPDPLPTTGTDRGGANSAFVRLPDVQAATNDYYALSYLEAGNPDMSHPMTQPGSGPTYPTVSTRRKCADDTASLTVTDPLFDVTVEVRNQGRIVSLVPGVSDGHGSRTFTFRAPPTADEASRQYQITATNSVGASQSATLSANGCTIFAMGDSYSSGEGSDTDRTPYQEGSDVIKVNMCHRGQEAYAPRLNEEIGGKGGSFGFAACSGATTEEILTKAKWPTSLDTADPQWPDEHVYGDRSQLADLIDFKGKGKGKGGTPEVITLSIGGNDAHFEGIIVKCLLLDCNVDPIASGIFKDTHAIFDDVVAALSAIREEAPTAEIYVLGYPSPVSADTGDCGSLDLWGAVAHRRISRLERAWLDSQLLPYLNSVIEAAAKKSGVRYVDLSQALAGHEVCSADPYAHGLTFGNDRYVLNNASFHPTDFGQFEMFERLMEQTSHLIGKQTTDNPEPQPLVKVPPVPHTTGTGVIASTFDIMIANSPTQGFHVPVRIGSDTLIRLSGHDFAPNTPVRGTLYSTQVDLGSATSDAHGDVTLSVRIPAAFEIGLHHVELTGQGTDGSPRVGLATLYVEASPADADGDSVPDTADNCTFVVNPDQADQDHDGQGNLCDPNYQLTVHSQPPVFAVGTPPERATVGVPYAFEFRASGATTYALASGRLPLGLRLDTSGRLSGVPAEAGTSTFSVVADGAYGQTIAGPFRIEVRQPDPEPTPTPSAPVESNPPSSPPVTPAPEPTPEMSQPVGHPTPTELLPQSVRLRVKSLKPKKTARLPKRSTQGAALTWKSMTKKVCKVNTRKVKALRKGKCVLKASAPAVGGYRSYRGKFTIKVRNARTDERGSLTRPPAG